MIIFVVRVRRLCDWVAVPIGHRGGRELAVVMVESRG